MSARKGMLQTQLDELKTTVSMQSSQFTNTLITIKEHAEAEDYDAIKALISEYLD